MAARTVNAPSFTRRSALRLLAGAALAATATRGGARDAEATRTWCRTDPVVMIDGQIADVFLGSYWDLHKAASGPAQIVISVPPGVSTKLLACDPGFGRHGYAVSFQQDPSLSRHGHETRLVVTAFVPSSDGSLPLVVSFTPRSSGLEAASATGLVNQWVTLRTK
jgi:hypothetical protein